MKLKLLVFNLRNVCVRECLRQSRRRAGEATQLL
jgi:hypothetical protein